MAGSLSAGDVSQLQAVLKALLSPLEFASIEAWRRETGRAIASLLGCPTWASELALPGEPVFLCDKPIAWNEYLERHRAIDAAPYIFHAHGTGVYVWSSMLPLLQQRAGERWAELYNDWIRKQGLCHAHALVVARSPGELPGGPLEELRGLAGLMFYQDDQVVGGSEEREQVLLGVLLPAFEASVHMLVRCGSERVRLAQALGQLGDGAVLFEAAAHVAYENPALGGMLADDREAPSVRAACAQLARLLLGLAAHAPAKSRADPILEPLQRLVRTAVARYRLRGALIGPGPFGNGPVALVVVECTTPTATTLARWREHYHLTPRELAVSQLLSEGCTNANVALLLGVSTHTARRHVEHVLMKLGVHSRAAVGAHLREGTPSAAPEFHARAAIRG